MPADGENRTAGAAQRGAVATPEPPRPVNPESAASSVMPGASGTAHPTYGTQALAVRETGTTEEPPEEAEGDTRLDHMPMQLDVMVKVRSFCVQDLLALERGTVVETVHEHTQDIPVRCGGALLVWAEFEVMDQQLAVRITRLA